jgi:hypothetical protein
VFADHWGCLSVSNRSYGKISDVFLSDVQCVASKVKTRKTAIFSDERILEVSGRLIPNTVFFLFPSVSV